MGFTRRITKIGPGRAGTLYLEGRGDNIPGKRHVGQCMDVVINMVHLPSGEETDLIVE